MKTCNDCKVEKKPSSFYKRVTRKGTVTLTSYCAECMVKRARAWQLKNPEKYKEYHKNYVRAKKV